MEGVCIVQYYIVLHCMLLLPAVYRVSKSVYIVSVVSRSVDIVLCYIVLHCMVWSCCLQCSMEECLYCAVSYCIALYCVVLVLAVLCGTVLYRIVLLSLV